MKKMMIFLTILVFTVSAFADITLNSRPGAHNTGTFIHNPGTRDILYEQLANISEEGGISSQDFEASFDAYDAEGADEFVIPVGETWTINEVVILGTYSVTGPCDLGNVRFYADDAGMPGTLLFEYLDVPASPTATGDLDCLIPDTALPEGTYWLGFQGRLDFGLYGQWFWTKQAAPTIGYEFYWRNPLDGFGTGCTTWTIGSIAYAGYVDYNLSFGLYGTIEVEVPEPPQNLAVECIDDYAHFTWEAPAGGGQLYELIQHDGNPVNGYFQSFDYGYGVVYDVSGYTDVTLEMLDFRHSSWGLYGTWDYALHIVDWDTYTELAVVTGLQTTGNDIWEEEIDLGSVSETGLVGVFMEPMGNSPTDAYPCIDSDDVGPNGMSYFGALANYSAMTLSGIGDFLMDLWIMAEEVDGVVKATRFEANFGSGISRVESTIPDIDFITLNQTSNLRDLLSYDVYLDAVYVDNTTDLEWDFYGLINGEFYDAGVVAVYDEGESELVEINFEYTGTGADNIISNSTQLNNNYPNPFNPVTNIAFSLGEPGHVTLEVYNIKGEKVRTLVDKVLAADNHVITWNGKDNNNKSVASGIYFYKMISEGNNGDYTSTKKMILLK
ncbi:MAG: T9SS type A sorting domain-containing protein [Candidatus Cloacimonetes bacterium]|nr:T9SS type A sorting domain-containing protein [Candidatus Cloacimonadota bacterium]